MPESLLRFFYLHKRNEPRLIRGQHLRVVEIPRQSHHSILNGPIRVVVLPPKEGQVLDHLKSSQIEIVPVLVALVKLRIASCQILAVNRHD